MHITDYPTLLNVLSQNKKIIYVYGSGMSMALGRHELSWKNWLLSSEEYFNDEQKQTLQNLITSTESDALIDAAGFVLSQLKTNGCYDSFMKKGILSLYPVQQDLCEANRLIIRSGDVIATTNYDLLVERSTGLNSVTYSSPGEIVSILNKESASKVIHLHGMYDPIRNVDNIVANKTQYDAIVQNAGAQFVQNLIGTHTVVFVGCGATISDPNLSGFIMFASKYLNLDIPYFYLCKSGDTIPDMPSNVIPIIYGDNYSDLPSFFKELSSYRIKYHSEIESLIQINPYLPSRKTIAPYGRLHFTNSFHSFVGREEEQDKLNRFAQKSEKVLWWTVIGEGGAGKSRLLLEWIRRLPVNWFGFFMKRNIKADLCRKFVPFTDTVVVIDYVLGQEEYLAQAIPILISAFEKTDFKLRIVFLERHFDVNARNGWYSAIEEAMASNDFIRFNEAAYKENMHQRKVITPMELTLLNPEDEKKYVDSYLEACFESVLFESAKPDLSGMTEKIVSGFHRNMKEAFLRPLFLSIYIEVWIYKEGDFEPLDVEDLLKTFLQREEKRWLEVLGNDEDALDWYLQILALASAIDIACINSGDNGYLQNISVQLYAKLHQGVQHGKKPAWDDLFIWKEKRVKELTEEEALHHIADSNSMDNMFKRGVTTSLSNVFAYSDEPEIEPDYYMLISPEYPDIIREFIVDYYIPETDIVKFAKAARNQSTFEFGFFLSRAIEDFPEKKSFAVMAITPPEYASDLFEFYITLLCSTRELIGYRKTIECVLQKSLEREDFIVACEMELWRRIAIVLQENDSDLTDSVQNFLDYVRARLDNTSVIESLPDMIDTYVVGFYNQRNTAQLEAFLDNVIGEFIVDGYIATQCSKGFYWLAVLRENSGDSRRARKELENIILLANQYPGDVDITLSLAKTARIYIHAITRRHMSGRITNANDRLMREFGLIDKTDANNSKIISEIAGNIAICLMNEYFEYHDVEFHRNNAKERMSVCESEINRLYQLFESEQGVVMAYSSMTADKLMDDIEGAEITKDQCEQFKIWFEQCPDEIEFAEAYGKVLFVRYKNSKKNGRRNEANRCVIEMKRVANLANYKDYGEKNQIKNVLDLIDSGII